MRRYLYAYALWFAFVATCAMIAYAWYQHVEAIGREAVSKLHKSEDHN